MKKTGKIFLEKLFFLPPLQINQLQKAFAVCWKRPSLFAL
jgi:hypothetical protein